MPIATFLALAAALSAPAAGPVADKKPATAKPGDYAACMTLARRRPDAAIERAESLWKAGARAQSRHCLGIALRTKGRTREAGKVLFDLAEEEVNMPPAERAELFAQAGRAWLDAGGGADGERAFGRALALTPKDAALYIERAVLRGSRGRNFEALEDLNEALTLAPDNVDALVLRAAAWRRVGAPELAAQDINSALTLDPNRPIAWIERALLREGAGDRAGAVTAYRHARKLDPEGPAGRTAEAALARLERKTTSEPAPASPKR